MGRIINHEPDIDEAEIKKEIAKNVKYLIRQNLKSIEGFKRRDDPDWPDCKDFINKIIALLKENNTELNLWNMYLNEILATDTYPISRRRRLLVEWREYLIQYRAGEKNTESGEFNPDAIEKQAAITIGAKNRFMKDLETFGYDVSEHKYAYGPMNELIEKNRKQNKK